MVSVQKKSAFRSQPVRVPQESRMASKRSTDAADVGNAKEFAIAFTIAVTETSANPREWIAKNGKDSIFALLQEIYPEASSS